MYKYTKIYTHISKHTHTYVYKHTHKDFHLCKMYNSTNKNKIKSKKDETLIHTLYEIVVHRYFLHTYKQTQINIHLNTYTHIHML